MFKIAYIYLISIFYITLIFAQSLPEGRHHRIRERTIDIIHYQADLKIDFEQKSVSGSAAIIFVPLTLTDTLSLDAINLDIEKVSLSRESESQTIRFKNDKYKLRLLLNSRYTRSDTLKLIIQYNAQPNAGMYFVKDYNSLQQQYCFTYGEGGLHANWLPIYNDVNDKFSTEMIVTVSETSEVISNGRLIKVEEVKPGWLKYHWKQELQHSNYLIALYIGEFEKGELPQAFNSIPINYWVPKGRSQEAAFVFQNTTRMVEFFSNKFNYYYPWEKYDQIVIPDYSIGGMEHTSVTGLSDYVLRNEMGAHNTSPSFVRYWSEWTAEGLISHELAHMWFGDLVTCRNLNYIWLNESFATYLQVLWDEEFLGEEVFDLDRRIMLDNYLKYVKEQHTIRPLEYGYYDKIDDIYNEEHTYTKGALILDMLRSILGDEDFFNACSFYLHKHEFSNVVSNDFKIAIEEATGKNLDWFFEDWVYGGGHPVFEVSYDYYEKERIIDLTVQQIQPIIKGQNLFKVPLEISIATSEGIRDKEVWVEESLEKFVLPCSERPHMVSVDGKGALVAEIHFTKPLSELIFQVKNDQLPGRIRALRQLVETYPVHPNTLQLIDEIMIGPVFWGLKAEATLLLGEIRSIEAQKLINKSLQEEDYRIRKATAFALSEFPPEYAQMTLRNIINTDTHDDVVATAILALAKVKPDGNSDFIGKQFGRSAWYDEITMACLMAFAEIADDSLVPLIKKYITNKYNQYVRKAALKAWMTCKPHDDDLSRYIIGSYKEASYYLQIEMITMLEALKAKEALPLLEEIVQQSGDADIRYSAKRALSEIKRVHE